MKGIVLWLAMMVLLMGCTVNKSSTRIYSVYSGHVVGTCWNMSITVYLLEKARLPDEIDIEMLFESLPVTGFHQGQMKYNGRYYNIMAKVEDISSSHCDRPLSFLCSVDRQSPSTNDDESKVDLSYFRGML